MSRKGGRTSRSSAPPISADYLIITALEEERDALLRQLPRCRKLDKEAPDVHTYFYDFVRSSRKDKALLSVVVTCLAGMGPTEAATRATIASKRWAPKYVLLVGIACGVKGEVEHGDLLLATQVADYSLGKLKDGDREIRWTVSLCGASLLDSAINISNWRRKIDARRPGAGECQLRKGVVASGGDVIADDNVIRAYSVNWPKLVGIEMEAGGIAAALHQTPDRPEFLMIKGVSDFGADKHDQAVLPWRNYASHAAAAFARALIEGGPPGHPKIDGTPKVDDDERRKAAERRWAHLQRNRLKGVEVSFLLKSPVGQDWLRRVLDDTRISFSRTGPSFKIGTVFASGATPNAKERSPAWQETICAFWERYEPNPDYYVQRIAPAYTAGSLVIGFDASIPWADLKVDAVCTLEELGQLTDIGVGIPPEAFMAGVEEFELTFHGEQFSFQIPLSDHGLEFLHEMASTHFQVSERGKGAPLSLGSSFSGFQLLEMFLEQLLPDKNTRKKKRGLFSGMGGPGGRAIRFYPDVPKGFMDGPEGKDYVFTVTVPKSEDIKSRIAALEAAVEDGSADAQMIGELAARYSAAGRLLDAIQRLQVGIARVSPNADLHGLLGESLGKLGRHEEAIEHFRRAEQLDPDNAAAHCGLAISLSTTGDDEGALRHFQLAASLEPSHAGHQKNLGRALASADRYGEAARCYERAMEIGPEDGESLILLGVLYDELGESDKAEASFQSATQVAPDDAEAHENLGRHVASTGDHARAALILKRAIEIEESARRYELLGASLADLSQWSDAEDCFQRAAKLAPDTAQFVVNAGICQANQGRRADAVRTLTGALQIDSANNLAIEVLSGLQEAELPSD